jgi:hypothetical protein
VPNGGEENCRAGTIAAEIRAPWILSFSGGRMKSYFDKARAPEKHFPPARPLGSVVEQQFCK